MSRWLTTAFIGLLAGAMLFAGAVAAPVRASAILYVAPTGSDANACDQTHPCLTINGAIGKASSGDAIDVAVGTYTAGSSSDNEVVLVSKNITLSGGWNSGFTAVTGKSTIDGQGNLPPGATTPHRGMTVPDNVTASISNFVIEHGGPPSGRSDGGGVSVGGSLTITDSLITDNHAAEASGIEVGDVGSHLTLLRTTVSDNTCLTCAGAGGGLSALFGSTTRIVESTFIGNSALNGGAIYMDGTTSVALVNSTITQNQSGWDGAALFQTSSGVHFEASSSTIAGNSAGHNGGGLVGGAITLRNTIVAQNTFGNGFSGPDCVGTITSAGNNLIGNTAGCTVSAQSTDILNGQALLEPAADNGGPTFTMAVDAGSDAVDAGNATGCVDDLGATLTTDQRGEARNQGNACDIGAYEVGPPANDDFANAQALADPNGSLVADTRTASIEPGEPEHAGDEGGSSLWYAWTPGTSGAKSIDTIGSDFDTLLGVYTQHPATTGVDHLDVVAANDDYTDTSIESRACFQATAGTTYYIAVDGYAGDAGTAHLRWGAKTDSVPCAATPPTVTGSAQVGSTLHSAVPTWVNPATPMYQWLRCQAEECDPISGATDTTYVVVARDVGTVLRLEVSETGGGSTQTSTSAPTATVVQQATAHQNGRIFWASNRVNLGVYHTFSMRPGGTDPADAYDVTPSGGSIAVPSPDGTRVAYVTGGGITIANADGSNAVATGVRGTFPVWSPDGSRIAYTSGTGSLDGIGIFDVNDPAHPVQLLEGDPATFFDSAWSPDGSTIAFAYRPTQSSEYEIYSIAASGRGGTTQLTNSGSATVNDESPAWSPDGTTLLFIRQSTSSAFFGTLYRMDADGQNQAPVPGLGSNQVGDAVYSPDGTTILYSGPGANVDDLFTMPAGGGASTRITTNGNRDEVPAWAPLAQYALSVSTSGFGTVTSSPAGIDCGASCTASYSDSLAQPVTLTPTPASGWTFNSWSGACSGNGPCTVSMLGARSVTATFTQPSSGGGGGGGGGGGASGGIPPDLHMDITASAQNTPAVGAELDYFITVRTLNVGGSSETTLKLTLPTGYTLLGTSADRGPGCTGTPPNLTCNVAWINQSTMTHLQVRGTVGQAGEQDLTANVSGYPEPEANPADNTVTFKIVPFTPPPPPPPTGGTTIHVQKPPAVTGKPTIGSTIRATPPKWSSPPTHVTYQWQLCTATHCTAIRGATKLTLKLVAKYAGHTVRLVTTGDGVKAISPKIAVRRR